MVPPVARSAASTSAGLQFCCPQTKPANPAAAAQCKQYIHLMCAYMVVGAAAHNGIPWWWRTTLLSRCEPIPGTALQLAQDQQTRKLRRGMVRQRTQ